jgi:hypothetical protein
MNERGRRCELASIETEGRTARAQLPDNPLAAERRRTAANENQREFFKCKTGRFHVSAFP